MVTVGYNLMCEQTPPKDLVDYVVRAEEAGFDLAVMSDHYYPWLDAQGHSPYAWSVLGAAAYATSRIDLMSFVTCPIRRYHPAVVASGPSSADLAGTHGDAIVAVEPDASVLRLFDEAGGQGKPRYGQVAIC